MANFGPRFLQVSFFTYLHKLTAEFLIISRRFPISAKLKPSFSHDMVSFLASILLIELSKIYLSIINTFQD